MAHPGRRAIPAPPARRAPRGNRAQKVTREIPARWDFPVKLVRSARKGREAHRDRRVLLVRSALREYKVPLVPPAPREYKAPLAHPQR